MNLTSKEIIAAYKELNTEEKGNVLNNIVFIGTDVNLSIDSKLKTIKLLAFLLQKVQKNNMQTKTYDILKNIVNTDIEVYNLYLLNLGAIVDELTYGTKEIEIKTFSTSKEVINEIQKLIDVNKWIPF